MHFETIKRSYQMFPYIKMQDAIYSTETWLNTINAAFLKAILEHILQGFGSPLGFEKIWVPYPKLEKLVTHYCIQSFWITLSTKFQIFVALYRLHLMLFNTITMVCTYMSKEVEMFATAGSPNFCPF